MGGKPKPGTPKDKRLSANKGDGKSTSMPKTAQPFGGKKANPFGSGKKRGR